MQQLSQSLAENLSALDARFGQSADYYAKKIVLYGCPGCIVMFDGMASLDSLWELLLDAAGRQSASVRLTGTQAYAHILHGSAFPAESTPVQDMPQLVARLTAGMAVLLLEGCSSGIVFSVQGLKFRSVEEPSAEGNLRGSREGFTDLLRVNLSLLRRLVRTDTLVQEAAQAHTCCNTEYALCYCKDRADPAMVQRVRAILQSARPELLLDSSYFVPWLLPGKARLFTPVHYTERPAVAAAKLCEGKLVILVNGSPSALVLPALFSEQFECLDDYASTAVFSSFLRVLKYFSFYLTVFLPGVFVCVAVHLPELLPPQLLYKIEAAEKATPLPLFAEMLLVILLLEIIREAGLRIIGDYGLNIINSPAAQQAAALGCDEITLSFECERNAARNIHSPVPIGVIAYGRLPLMLLRNCPGKTAAGCGDCRGINHITDRRGEDFPLQCQNRQYTHLLNPRPLFLSDRLPEWDFCDFLTLRFTTESPAECDEVLKMYQTGAAPAGSFTRGLYYRTLK